MLPQNVTENKNQSVKNRVHVQCKHFSFSLLKKIKTKFHLNWKLSQE